MDKDYISITHKNESDHETFVKSIDTYDNPTYGNGGRIETTHNSDGTYTTTVERQYVSDFKRLGEDADLTGAIRKEIGTDD